MKKFLFLLPLIFIGSLVCGQQTINGSITHGGLQRTYILYVPATYSSANPAPLVLNFHGYTSNASDQMFYGDFRSIADTAGFLVVHPQGTKDNTGTNHWNVGWGGSTVDDVDFTDKLLDSLSAQFSIDQNRIYSTGMSNGGFMSYQLACKLSNRIAAIASVTGSMTAGATTSCNCGHPMPIMEIHGTADATVAYNGTGWHSSVEQVLLFWSAFNNTDVFGVNYQVPNIAPNDGCIAEHLVYPNGDNGATVEHFKVIGGAHTWPGAPIAIGITNMDFDASDEIWKFFSRYSLADLTVSRENTEPGSIFEVFPNPAAHSIRVTLSQLDPSWEQLSLLDANGRLIHSQNLSGFESEIDISSFTPGVYLLKAGPNTTKILIER